MFLRSVVIVVVAVVSEVVLEIIERVVIKERVISYMLEVPSAGIIGYPYTQQSLSQLFVDLYQLVPLHQAESSHAVLSCFSGLYLEDHVLNLS